MRLQSFAVRDRSVGACVRSPRLGGLAMPRPLPVPVRRALYRRWCQGQAASAIAAALGLALTTVCSLLRRFRAQGEAGVRPGYGRCGPRAPRAAAEVVQAALALRRAHRSWGAGLI